MLYRVYDDFVDAIILRYEIDRCACSNPDSDVVVRMDDLCTLLNFINCVYWWR